MDFRIVWRSTLASVLLIRLVLLIISLTGFGTEVYEDSFHHFYVGVAMLFTLIFLKNIVWQSVLLGIGIGLIIDEICLIYCLAFNTTCYYWSTFNLIVTVITLLITYLILLFIRKNYAKIKN